MTITVTHLITDLITAGAQKALYRLLCHTDRTRYRPVVIALRDGNTEIGADIRALGVEVIDLNMAPRWRLDRLMPLYAVLRHQRPDILHCWMIHSNIIGRVVGRAARVPKIIVSRRNDVNGSRWATVLNRWLVNWSDTIIAVSKSARQAELRETGIAPERVIVVPNGIEMAPFLESLSAGERQALRQSLGLEPDHFVIGSVGRLVEAKGYTDLLHAFKLVSEQLSTARLIIFGKGILEEELKTLAHALGIAEKVQFPGVRSDIPKVLQTFDLFAFSSHWEGMPNALMEAMAAGLPCIATEVSAAPELIEDGVHGLLVPPKRPEQLAQGIQKLWSDRDKRAQLGANGQARIQTEFTLAHTAALTQKIYHNLLIKS